jgi:hypothetical protein
VVLIRTIPLRFRRIQGAAFLSSSEGAPEAGLESRADAAVRMSAGPPRRSRRTAAALLVALAAGGVLLSTEPDRGDSAAPPGPITAAAAWPGARRADLPGTLADGTTFDPELFLTADTVLGTAPSRDGRRARLLLRTTGGLRELRRLPTGTAPGFDDFVVAGDDVAWAESADEGPISIWSINLRNGRPARRLTADTGNAVFYGGQNDLVVAGGRVHWAASAADPAVTEIRSVALTGGPVTVRQERGTWGLSTWPWLTDAAGGPSSQIRLRDLSTGREVRVAMSAGDAAECSPVWCRVMVSDSRGLVRIDLMRPDGSARRRIAGAGTLAAVVDVAILDRFEILSQAVPGSDVTGVAGLRVYDISTGDTVDIAAGAGSAFARAGVLWWSTGSAEAARWHSLDLRTA